MSRRSRIWLLVSGGILAVFCRLCFLWLTSSNVPANLRVAVQPPPDPSRPMQVLRPAAFAGVKPGQSQRAFPVSNSPATLHELITNPRAILLANAWLDTSVPVSLPIPEALRAGEDPGAYIVQARLQIDDAFRARLRAAGAAVVAYIPNRAYLVQASTAAAKRLAADPRVQAVVPYAPYFKLSRPLLELVNRSSTDSSSVECRVNVLLFAEGSEAAVASSRHIASEISAEERTPFGPRLAFQIDATRLVELARLPGVQEIEPARQRRPANDLSRAMMGVASSSVNPIDYLGLTGSNVVVAVNDLGVDVTHPDLAGRAVSDTAAAGLDPSGHGTHMAAVIAGNGAQSLTINNAAGSAMPPTASQFRGQAARAKLFSISLANTDAYLQQTAARTNACLSNNSWTYDSNDYDLAAASYDAAVRDALPEKPGMQPIAFVFAAGNVGQGNADGSGGNPGSIQSPGTAKNVITVGAADLPRSITNQTWNCNGAALCQTNLPWLGATDSTNQVASFSSRGNVGRGSEGEFGRFKPDVVAPGVFVVSARASGWNASTYYSAATNFFGGSSDTNYGEVLSNLNEQLGPYYRYESGTSVAAAQVSGVLALVEEFFQQRLHVRPSPALLKALLINGARSLGAGYDAGVNASTNAQGWGLVQLAASLPAALTNWGSSSNALWWFDQSASNALATGQSQTRSFTVNAGAQDLPLNLALVWTDPPGNPAAGIKLVNNLDLVITNLDNGQVFFGNDILPGSRYNMPWNPSDPPNLDLVNNVEVIRLAPPLGTHYSVTVSAPHVPVNAVSARVTDTVQDFALVLASGNGEVADALTMSALSPVGHTGPLLTSVTNMFSTAAFDAGAILPHERTGASAPLTPGGGGVPLTDFTNATLSLGDSNQWHFYVIANDQAYTNAAFLTYAPVPLSVGSGSNAADVDLYVSQDSALTNLDPAAVAAADKSLSRGGTETIVYSNANPGPYYIAVKSESQGGGEFGLAAVFSEEPFAQADPQDNQLLRGFPATGLIPAGSSRVPGSASFFAICPSPAPVHRVIMTNQLTHPQLSDLVGTLAHQGVAAELLNHAPPAAGVEQVFIYDDSGEGDTAGSQTSDGPGRLSDFAGQPGLGQWQWNIASTNQPGTDAGLALFVEAQPDPTTGMMVTVLPGACRQDVFPVAWPVTNVSVSVSLLSGTGPVLVQLTHSSAPGTNGPNAQLNESSPSGVLILDSTSEPPLLAGECILRFCNQGPDAAVLSVLATPTADPNPAPPIRVTSTDAISLADDAVSVSTLNVTNNGRIASLAVGVRINHPRVSDLALSLVGPDGTTARLFENRGGTSTDGLGLDVLVTNVVPVSFSGGPEAVTNVIDTGERSGVINISYDFYSLADEMHVYYEGNLIYDSGFVSNSGSNNISYGPGNSTALTVIMNEGGSSDTNTFWRYVLTSTRLKPLYFAFTENTNLATVPVKFATPPFTNVNSFDAAATPSQGISYLPEEPLSRFDGRCALGPWTLELWDTRAGATNPSPALVSWQLSLVLQDTNRVPIAMNPGVPITNTVAGGQFQWVAVDVPIWSSFATNALLDSSVPLTLWLNTNVASAASNSGAIQLGAPLSQGAVLMSAGGQPPLLRGSRYYLGLQNPGPDPATFALAVNFDVTNVVTLSSGQSYFNQQFGPAGSADYYRFVVSSNSVRVQFEIEQPVNDLTLAVKKGLPPPSLAQYDYLSANPGTNDELIVIFDASHPVALTPGEWFASVINPSGLPTFYSMIATEFSSHGTNLLLTAVSAETNAFCLSWNSLPGVHYYLQGKAQMTDANWTLLSGNITANDVVSTWCLPLPSIYHFFRVHEGLVLNYPTPGFSGIGRGPGGVWLNWTGQPGIQCQVEWVNSLNATAWNSFTNILVNTNGFGAFLDDGSQAGGLSGLRYYRLRQLP